MDVLSRAGRINSACDLHAFGMVLLDVAMYQLGAPPISATGPAAENLRSAAAKAAVGSKEDLRVPNSPEVLLQLRLLVGFGLLLTHDGCLEQIARSNDHLVGGEGPLRCRLQRACCCCHMR